MRRLRLIIVTGLFFGLGIYFLPPVPKTATSSSAGPSRYLASDLPTDLTLEKIKFSVPELQRLISEYRPKNVEELISRLPKALRMNFILIGESGSLQTASYAEPRVLLISGDASFVMTFNGGQGKGADEIEIIQFNSPSFDFKRVNFVGGIARIVQPMGDTCTRCHGGTNPRPNWEPYSEWPGVIFSGLSGKQDMEKGAYRSFMDSIKVHPRYRYLEGYEREDYEDILDRRAIAFTGKLFHHNFSRMAELIVATAEYKHYRYAIAAMLGYCSGWEEALLPEMRPTGVNDYRANFKNAPTRPQYWRTQINFFWLFESRGINTRLWPTKHLDHIQESIFNPLNTPAGEDGELLYALQTRDPVLKQFISIEAKPQEYYGSSARVTEESCKKIKDASIRSLEALKYRCPTCVLLQTYPLPEEHHTSADKGTIEKVDYSSRDKAIKILTKTCAHCHTGVAAPKIPFSDPLEFEYWLKSNTERSRILERISPDVRAELQMPPSGEEIPEYSLVRSYIEATSKTNR